MAGQIREGTKKDALGVARVHVDAWRAAYRGQMPDEVLDGLDVKERADRWKRILDVTDATLLVLDVAGEIVGFVVVGPSRDGDAVNTPVAEISAIYVHPQHWRSGYGRQLLDRARAHAVDEAFEALTLWVLVGNERAIAFYEAEGFTPDGASKIDRRLVGHELHEVRYRTGLPSQRKST